MYLVKVNGVDVALVERAETVKDLESLAAGAAAVFGGDAPVVESFPMPRLVLGGGHVAFAQAANAMFETLKAKGS